MQQLTNIELYTAACFEQISTENARWAPVCRTEEPRLSVRAAPTASPGTTGH